MNVFFESFISSVSHLDDVILYAVQSIGPAWRGTGWFLSHGIGSYPIMLAVLATTLFMIEKKRVALELVIIATISFAALFLLKHYFDAPRPYTIDQTVIAYDREDDRFGLPSGHALMSVVILGWVMLKHPKSNVLLWGGVSLAVLIGFSRIYLGVHYPSQVLAGWLFGILFLYIFYTIDKRLWAPFKKQISKR